MKKGFLAAFMIVLSASALGGCETPQAQKNLADGTVVEKEGWFRMRAEKEHLEPHEQRREDASYLGRKK
jgi:hypothetical protein